MSRCARDTLRVEALKHCIRWMRAHAAKPARRLGALLLVVACVLPTAAQDAAASDPGIPVNPGLLAAYAGAGGLAHTLQRLPALHVQPTEAPAPGLQAGPFTVVFEGFLQLELRTRLSFSAEGRGRVRVFVRGQLVLEGEADDLSTLKAEAFRIRKGRNPLRIEYTAPPTGAAVLRLCWQGDAFVREPIPPEAFTHARSDTNAGHASRSTQGRALFAALRCVNCHEADVGFDHSQTAFGLGATAPSLVRSGERLDAEWIARWIIDPQAMRKNARMPRLLPQGTTPEAALTLARSIARGFTLDAAAAPPPVAPEAASAQRGAALVADLGCATCHLLPGAAPLTEDDRVELTHVAAKFRQGALATFLTRPDLLYPATRMPRFALTEAEASDIESHLRSIAVAPTPANAVGSPCAPTEFRCQQCHDPRPDTMLPAAPLAAIAQEDWTAKGCASANPSGSMARFDLPAHEVQALEAFRKVGVATAFKTSAQERARTAVHELRCQACHVLDGTSDLWTTRFGPSHTPGATTEAEKLSQTRPELTFIGEKLHQPWVRRVLQGDPATRMRPWLRAKMPAFPAHADLLARGLADQHGWPETIPTAEVADAETLAIGAQLIAREGFGCTACHWLNGNEPYATFEFGATDLALAGQRLRKDHALRWLWKPQRIMRSSRMPSYATAEERLTAQDGIWDGDAQRQFGAMWAWLSRQPATTHPK